MAEAKHAFVDDNPYLVYSPNAEMTYDGNSGGGGGGGTGFPVIEMNAQTGALSVTAGTLKEMLEISPVGTFFLNGNNLHWVLLLQYSINDNKYYFTGTSIDSAENPMELFVWAADSASDNPAPFEP